MSNTNEFMLNIIAKLNKQLSKRTISGDLKSLDNTMYVKVLAKLSKTLASKEIKKQLKELEHLYVNVGIRTEKGAKDKIQKNIRILQKSIENIGIGLEASKLQQKKLDMQIEGIRKNIQKKVSTAPLEFNLQIKKDKLISDIEYTGKRFSKLFSFEEAAKKYQAIMQNALTISDKGQLSDTRAELAAFNSELKASDLASKSTGDRWKELTARAKDLFSAASIVRIAFNQVKEAVKTTIDLDKVYTDLVKVQSELTRNDYPDYLDRCNRKAQELASTQKALIEGAEEFSKSGYDLSTSDKLTEKSTILSNVGEMSASDSAKAIISGVQAYDEIGGYTDTIDKASELIDRYNRLGNEASITTAELAKGVQSVGSVFADSNTSVDQFLSLLSAGNRAYQNADSLALALRTSALRIRGASLELQNAGEDIEGVMSVLDNQKAIKALTGADILETDGETIRSIYDIFLDISKVYKDMADVDQSALLDIIAGKHRASAISATLNNMTEAEELLQKSISSAGSAQREYDLYLESTEAHLNQFQAKLVETYSNFVDGSMVSHVADLGTVILDLVNKTDLLKHSLIAIAAIKIGQGITAAGGAIAGTVTQMNALGNALQMVKDLPLENVLRKSALDEIGESTKSLTEKNLKLLLSQKQLNEADAIRILKSHELTKEEARAKLETMGLTTATNAQTAANTGATTSANTLKGAFTGLAASVKATWAAMSMLQKASIIFAAVSTAWSIGSSILSGMKQHNEELVQATKEAANVYTETSKSIDEYVSRYQELRQALIAAKDNEEETYNIKSQLLELQTELNDKFGEEYGRLNLVTDAYRDQTQAIKEFNKENANRFLNENYSGIEKAEKEMTGDKHYNLSGAYVNQNSKEGQLLKEIAEEYKDLGVTMNDGLDGTFSIHLKADAQSAHEVINDFMTDVKGRAEQLGMDIQDNIDLSGVAEMCSSSLEDANKTIDKYGEIFRQAQMAQVASDDNLSKGYNDALSAVKAYNEAVLKSENPYDDDRVAQAKQNLDAVKASIQENEAEWGKYSSLMDDVFDQADTRLYDFNEAFKTDSGMKELAEDLKGFTDLDLQAFDGKEGENLSFDKLKESAKEYGVSVEGLTSTLVGLGYVQSKVANQDIDSTETKSLPDAWESLKTTDTEELKDTRKELLALAEAGQLTEEAFHETAGADTFLDSINESLPETIKWINELASSSTQLQFMSAQVSKMSDMLAEKGKGNEAQASDLAGFDAEVRGLDSWEEFEALMGSSKSTMEQCQKAANNLATEFVSSNNFLANLNETNKDYYVTALQNMGVENAEIIVKNALTLAAQAQAAAEEFLAQKKAETENATYSLVNATAGEIQKFAEEKGYADNVTNALIELALKKQLVNNTTLDFSGDLANISNYVKALGSTAGAIGLLERIKKGKVYIPGDAMPSVIASAQAEIDAALAANTKTNVQVNPVGSYNYKPSSTPKSSSSKGSGSKSPSVKQEPQEIDWIARKLDRLQEKIDATKAAFENLFTVKSKAKNIDKQISQTKGLLTAAEKAAKKYKKYADSVKLSNGLKKKAQSGDYSIQDYSQKTADKISKYEGYYNKYKELQKQADELETQIRESKIEKNQLYVDAAEAKVGRSQAYAELDTANYKEQNKHLEAQKKHLKESYKYQVKIAELNKDEVEAAKLKAELKKEIRDLTEQEYQNVVDSAESKIDRSKAYAEMDGGNYKEQNKHLEAQKKYLKQSYDYKIKIAKLDKDGVAVDRLKAELKKEIRNLTEQEFDNIAAEYNNKLGAIEARMKLVNSKMEQLEAKGYVASSSYYSQLISQETRNLAQLKEEREALQGQMEYGLKEGSIKEGSDQWYEMVEVINEVENATIQATTSLAGYQNQLRQLEWDAFDRVQDYISGIPDEAGFLAGLMGNKELFDDGSGQWTEYATATGGLYAVNYNSYMSQADGYAREIQKINKELADDPYNTVLIERKQELIRAQQEAIKNAESEKQAIRDLVADGYNVMIEALEKIVCQRKEALDAEKDLYDYEKNVAKQTKNILNLEKQRLALQGDDSEEAKSQLQQITAKLEDARDNLEGTEYERWKSDQESMLDSLLDDVQEWVNQRLDNIDGLILDVITRTNANASDIRLTLEQVGKDVGYTLTGTMEGIWDTAGNVVSAYGDMFSSQLTSVNTVLTEIRNYVSLMQLNSEKESFASLDHTGSSKLDGEHLTGTGSSHTGTAGFSKTDRENLTHTGQSVHTPGSGPASVFTPLPSASTNTWTGIPSSSPSGTGSGSFSHIGSGTFSSTKSGGWGSWFIRKLFNGRRSGLDKDGSVIDRLKYFDFDSSASVRGSYYRAMGGDGTYTGSASQNAWMLSEMKKNGFKEGGTVGKLVRQSGEDGFILARTGEKLISLEELEAMHGTFREIGAASGKVGEAFSKINTTVDRLDLNRPNAEYTRTLETNRNQVNNIEVNMNLPNVHNTDEFVTELIQNKRLEKAVKEMTLGQALGKGQYNKFRI